MKAKIAGKILVFLFASASAVNAAPIKAKGATTGLQSYVSLHDFQFGVNGLRARHGDRIGYNIKGMNKNMVEVVPYNAEWPKMFEAEALLIKGTFGDNCLQVHHIGSTSVMGMKAKPIIDIIPVVRDITKVDKANEAMRQLGYECKGENGMLFRRYFEKGPEVRTHNVHVFEEGNPEIERHIKFRDWMRSHADDRELYGKLKENLAVKYPNEILSYCFGKDHFVAGIDKKTGFNGLRVVKALTPREWDAVEYFRKQHFFGKVSSRDDSSDMATLVFDQKNHIYFVLYQGVEIIGYAHIQLLVEQRAIINIIFIDAPYQNQDIDGKFLAICERWLKQHKFIVLRNSGLSDTI